MHYRRQLMTIALTFVLGSTAANAGGNPTIDAGGYNQQPAQTTRATTTGMEAADSLLRALVRRSIALTERNPSAAPAAAAQPQRARLSSRSAGAASHRTNGVSAPATNLAEYLGILSRTTPGGMVTGRFSDWRSPSMYRSAGGRHNGYDVALRAGSSVVVGWPGRVTSITNWYGREYGITIVSPDGFHTTYGHLAPAVRVGQTLEPGDVVGMVVRDHVDIKMKDAQNRPIDFAHSVPLTCSVGERPVASAVVAGVPGMETNVLPALAGPDWTQRAQSVKAALNYVRLRYQEASLLSAGTATPAALLSQVRQQLSESRNELAVEEVPEEILLAAFLDSPSLQASLSVTDPNEGGSNALAEWLRRQQVTKDARLAGPRLQQLLHDLGE